jgi:hypothetical protein
MGSQRPRHQGHHLWLWPISGGTEEHTLFASMPSLPSSSIPTASRSAPGTPRVEIGNQHPSPGLCTYNRVDSTAVSGHLGLQPRRNIQDGSFAGGRTELSFFSLALPERTSLEMDETVRRGNVHLDAALAVASTLLLPDADLLAEFPGPCSSYRKANPAPQQDAAAGKCEPAPRRRNAVSRLYRQKSSARNSCHCHCVRSFASQVGVST